MQSIRGMHDILPEEIKYWQYIYKQAFKILDTANYKEIRTPIVELQSLFARSIGEGTDIINKEMYTFQDRGERSLTLRPEGTAGIARAVIKHKLCDNNTIAKLWYLGPMFRYERPQQGRQRQFHQLGLEYYGNNHPMVDAETISLAYNILESLQCKSINLEINSIGTEEERSIYTTALQDYLLRYIEDLDEESKQRINTNPLRILDSKNPNIHSILESAPQITNYLQKISLDHFYKLQEYLNELNIAYKIQNKLVRGLDYYNNTVFEIKTPLLGTQDTICGGGRYNNLTTQIGGKQIDAIGWGIGVERLLMLVQKNFLVYEDRICIYIAVPNLEHVKYALKFIPLLQKNGLKYELDLSGCTLKKHLNKANKKQTMICLIIREEEVLNNLITIKWMCKQLQKTYSLDHFDQVLPNIKTEYYSILETEGFDKIKDNLKVAVDISAKSSDNTEI
uniref:Histidine--tRNA ligase, chloroplastic n=1 Tax=Titanophycus setchellii TaxID=940129 RepID=A0A1G4NYC8_9FLOR|nr:Histidine-tRNA ligase [Titanophycus setchellii]SCW23690.1 Histidine-tRNA ligase [Titanophycus setchellii]